MARLPAWRRYARFFGVDVRRDVDDELQFHLEEKTRALIAEGQSAENARAEALRQFGEVSDVRALCETWGRADVRRDERRLYVTGWGQDLRYALRMLRRTPLVSCVAILSIALGVGANTAIFTLLDQVMLRTLPVPSPERIVRLANEGFYYGSTNGTGRELSFPMFAALRDHQQVFDGMFAYFPFGAAVRTEGGLQSAEMTPAALVSGDYFSTLGVGVVRGRLLTPADDAPGAPPVAVITHSFWQRRFGGADNVLGRTILVGPQSLTIIGVVAPGFDGLNLTSRTELFVPLALDEQLLAAGRRLQDNGQRWLKIYARLKPGVTEQQAAASLAPFYRSLRVDYLNDVRFARATAATKQRYLNENHLDVVPGSDGLTPMRGQLRGPLFVLMAIVGGVLLIACANVANLQLARGAARQREVALRLSLGATRGRVVRQLVVESLVLAGIGAAAGVLLATIGVQGLLAFFVDPESPSLLVATPNPRVLGFTALVAAAAGLLFGLAPALQSTRPALAPTLKDQAGTVAGGAGVRIRKALVVSQVALSLLLLVGAGLFIRSFQRMMASDLGFRTEQIITFGANPTQIGYRGHRVKQYAMDLLARVRATRGVTSAAVARVPLLGGGAWGESLTIEGRPVRDNDDVGSRVNAVTPGYFATLGIPLRTGRDFTDTDYRVDVPGQTFDESDQGYRVAIVSESFAKRFLGSQPIGTHIGLGSDPGTPTRIQVVGVVGDSAYTGVTERRSWQIYLPFLESTDDAPGWFYVRTSGEPAAMLDAMRTAMRELEPAVPPLQLRTLTTQVNRSVSNQRFVTSLCVLFGVLATTLAMVGLYGVMAYTVTRRTRELGVRMALGAPSPRILWMILREALWLVGAGVACALPLSLAASRLLQSELYGASAIDPIAVAAATLLLAAVAVAAALVPSLKAARLDPLRALRLE
jgi:predicted permease